MKLGRPSRKLFLITLPSILPVGLKMALMRSRRKYLKQQKYTLSMKMNSFLGVSEEQGCARDNISYVLAVYFEKTGSQVLFCLLFAVAHRTVQNPAPSKLFTDAVSGWWQLFNMEQFGPVDNSENCGNPQVLWSTHNGLTIAWRGAGSSLFFHCRLGRNPAPGSLEGNASGVGWASSSQQSHGHWCPWRFAFETYMGKWGNSATGVRGSRDPADPASACAGAAEQETLGGVPQPGCTWCSFVPPQWDLFCLFLDNYSTDIFIRAGCLTQGGIGVPGT